MNASKIYIDHGANDSAINAMFTTFNDSNDT